MPGYRIKCLKNKGYNGILGILGYELSQIYEYMTKILRN